MARPLFQLGSFQFDLPNGVPQTLERTAEYRWEVQDRLLRDPAAQFIGPGSQDITLDGVLYPGFSGRQTTMETLRELAAQGQPQMLTDGLGRVYGKWAIRSIREGLNTFAPGGGARQITFSVALVRYGEDKPGLAASPLSLSLGSNLVSGFTGSPLNSPLLSGITGGFTDPGSAFSALAGLPGNTTAAATSAGFNLGQLGSIAQTGLRIASQVSSGNYVNAALGAMGVLGISPDQSSGWAQIGINAANLAQAYATGKGPTGMALALEAATAVGAPALQQLGLVTPQNLQSIGNLLQSTATLGEILKVDPRVTDTLRPLIQIAGGS